MKKSELKTKISEVLSNYGQLDTELGKELLQLVTTTPKSSRIIKMIDGEEYRNCRFTGRLWPLDELVYQNDEYRTQGKDKGYSKIGISLWNKGQKYIKNLETKMIDLIMSGEDASKVATELKQIKENNLGNKPEWLLQFATPEQEEIMKSKSYPLDFED